MHINLLHLLIYLWERNKTPSRLILKWTKCILEKCRCKAIPDEASSGNDFSMAVVNRITFKTQFLSFNAAISWRGRVVTQLAQWSVLKFTVNCSSVNYGQAGVIVFGSNQMNRLLCLNNDKHESGSWIDQHKRALRFLFWKNKTGGEGRRNKHTFKSTSKAAWIFHVKAYRQWETG